MATITESVEESDEFYPDLICVLINFIDKYERELIDFSQEYIEIFGHIINQSLFHISKESGLQFVLEDIGWFASNRDYLINNNNEFYSKLKYNLTKLYWEQIEQCLPNFNNNNNDNNNNNNNNLDNVLKEDNNLISFLNVENHPNLFNDHVATYSYLPNILLNNLLQYNNNKNNKNNNLNLESIKFEGVCMLADISGFTKLSGRCCAEGIAGLDKLHDACSDYLGKFVQTVYSYKGDVIAFAGDALIVIFPLDILDVDKNILTNESIINNNEIIDFNNIDSLCNNNYIKNILKAKCCQRAVLCSKILTNFYTDELTAHVGISYGSMSIAKLGGFENQWVYLMNGACISQISSCVDDALSKQVCITSTVFENLFLCNNKSINDSIIENNIDDNEIIYKIEINNLNYYIDMNITKMNETNNYRINSFIPKENINIINTIDKIPPCINIIKLISRFNNYCTLEYYAGSNIIISEKKQIDIDKFNENVKLFVPKPVIDAISFSTLETTSELRDVTTMFMKLDSYDTEKNRDPQTLQDFCYMAQQVLAKTGGFLRQFLIDDKGCVLIAMWGVPSFSFSNNSSRAVAAAMLIHDGTIKLNHKCSIGITAGTVFVGNIGSLVRRDFVGLGADVNLAARFMSKSKGKIYIDEKTALNLPNDIRNTMTLSDGLVLKGVQNLTYAYICDGDILKSNIQEFISSIKTKIINNLNINNLDNGDVLLPKLISEPIKKRLQKIQRRHLFILRDKGYKLPSGKSSNSINEGVTSSILKILPLHHIIEEKHKPHPINFIITEGMAGTGKTTTCNFFKFYAFKCHLNTASIQCIPADLTTPLSIIRKLSLQIIGEDSIKNNPLLLTKLVEQMHWDNHPNYPILSEAAKLLLIKRLLGLIKIVDEDSTTKLNAIEIENELNERDKINNTYAIDDKVQLKTTIKNEGNMTPKDFSVKNMIKYFSNSKIVPSKSFSNISSRLTGQIESNILSEDIEADTELPKHTDNEGIFFHMFYVLLNHQPYAIIIDDAHNCDEASWNIIYMLSHLMANAVIYITVKSLHAHITNDTNDENQNNNNNNNNKTLLNNIPQPKSNSQLNLTPTSSIQNNFSLNINSNIKKISSVNNNSNNSNNNSINSYGNNNNSNNNNTIETHGFKKSLSTIGKIDTTPMRFEKNQFAWSKAHHISNAYLQLVKNPFVIHLILHPFTLNDVRNYMCKALHTKELPETLIQSIYQVSTGSPYWCKQIANFILERGHEYFISTTLTDNKEITTENVTMTIKQKPNPLHVLIICRLESMTIEQQAVIKHASIIGEEFHAVLLDKILPPQLKIHLIETIDVLVNNCLLFSDNEDTDMYKFGNHLIHKIIYDLTPPSEAAKLHKVIGDSIEDMHNKDTNENQDVVVYYQLLIYHYTLCPSARAKAFKYLVKSCDECVQRNSFEEVVKYAIKAKDIATSRTELRILQTVVNSGIESAQAKSTTQQLFKSSTRIDNSIKILASMDDINNQISAKIKELNITKGDEGNNDSGIIQNAIATAVLESDVNTTTKGMSTKDTFESPHRGGSTNFDTTQHLSQRKVSINLQRKQSRILDWEGEVVKKTEQQIAAEKEAAKYKSGCTIS